MAMLCCGKHTAGAARVAAVATVVPITTPTHDLQAPHNFNIRMNQPLCSAGGRGSTSQQCAIAPAGQGTSPLFCCCSTGAFSSSNSTAAVQLGPTLISLPFEALACIASLLEHADRRAFAMTCTAACQAVTSTTTSLVLPVIDPTSQQQQQQRGVGAYRLLQRYIGVQSLQITSCNLCGEQQQQQHLEEQHNSSSCCLPVGSMGPGQQQQQHGEQQFMLMVPREGSSAAAAAIPSISWGSLSSASTTQQQQQLLEQLVADRARQVLTGSHAAAAAAAAATSNAQQLHKPQCPATATSAAVTAAATDDNWHCLHSASDWDHPSEPYFGSGSSGSSLAALIAAAGSSMPYLTSLDLSGICNHSLLGSTAHSTVDPNQFSSKRATMNPNSSRSIMSCIPSSLIQSTDNAFTAAVAAAAADVNPINIAGCPNGLLKTICTACPNLAVLNLPHWLWQGLASMLGAQHVMNQATIGFSNPQALNPSSSGYPGFNTSPVPPYTCGQGLVIQVSRAQLAQAYTLGFKQALASEGLSDLTQLRKLRVLKLTGGPVPTEVLGDLGLLTQLHSLSVCASRDLLLPAAATPGSSSSSGTVLGTALSSLRSLVKLSLSGLRESGCVCLDQLSNLTNLTHLELTQSTDLKVGDLGSISGLSSLRILRIQKLKCLQATSRASLPIEWQNLKQLAAMLLDFNLHLRDIQVLAGMPQLTLLGAASLHICVNPRFGLSMPNIRHLALHTLPQLAVAVHTVPAAAAAAAVVQPAAVIQQAVQALQQQQQHRAVHVQQQYLQQQQLMQMQQFMLLPNGQQQQLIYMMPPGHGMMHAFPTAAAAAAGPAGPMYMLLPNQPLQQQLLPGHPTTTAAAAAAVPPPPAAAAAAGVDQGWLTELCPNLDELLVGILDANAFNAMKGHKTLKRIVFGIGSSIDPSSGVGSSSSSNAQQQQQQVVPMAVDHNAAAATALGWSMLASIPNLESVKVINTDDVLPANANLAIPHMRRLTSLTLQKASCIGDVEAWMISSYCRRLQMLAIEDAPALTDTGLRHLASLPHLKFISLTACPTITPQGLQQLLLYCPALKTVQLYCCTAIHADLAEAVQQAVHQETGRKVAVQWRSSRGGSRTAGIPKMHTFF